MKKILLSVAVIGVVGIAVVSATTAYFNDTETVVNNTITAGTIDIEVNDENPWTQALSIADLKPGETDYMNLRIENVGANPAEIYKRIYTILGTTGDESFDCDEVGGVSSDPECRAAQVNGNVDLNNLEDQILYDLYVEIYESEGSYDEGDNPVWWQTIEAGDRLLSNVYPNEETYIDLGMLPVGGYMFVEQSYHFDGGAGNIYQGDELSFTMEVKAEQLAQDQEGMASVILENKSGAPDWTIINDSRFGELTYKTKGATFDYGFKAYDLATGYDYQLIYYPDPWANPKEVILIGSAMTPDGSGNIDVSGLSAELNADLPVSTDDNYPLGAKIWLVPTTSLTGTQLSWTNTGNFLFDTSLITYDDTDL